MDAPPKSSAGKNAAGGPHSLLILVQHCLVMVPIGVPCMWASWPYHVFLAVRNTVGGCARARTFFREARKLGLPLVIPSIFLLFGSYNEVFTACMVS